MGRRFGRGGQRDQYTVQVAVVDAAIVQLVRREAERQIVARPRRAAQQAVRDQWVTIALSSEL